MASIGALVEHTSFSNNRPSINYELRTKTRNGYQPKGHHIKHRSLDSRVKRVTTAASQTQPRRSRGQSFAQFIGCDSNTLKALDSCGHAFELSSQRICGKLMYQLAGVESCLERIYKEYPKMNPFAGAGNVTNQCVLTYRFPTLAAKLKLSTSK